MRSFDELPPDAKRYARGMYTDPIASWARDCTSTVGMNPEFRAGLFAPFKGRWTTADDRFAYWAEVEYERRQLRAAEKRKAQECDGCGGRGSSFWTELICTACNGTGRGP